MTLNLLKYIIYVNIAYFFDFVQCTSVKSDNCKIICCIELDDYTHNRQNVIKKDETRNQIFKKVNIPLYRVKVSNYYNLEELENTIRNEMNK